MARAAAVRRVAARSARLRVCHGGAAQRDGAGELCPLAPRRAGRSDGGLEVRMMDTLFQDLRYAVRTLAKSSGFTLVAVLTLAVGIGANTAMFSVFYGVLLRRLPYAEPDRIVGLAQTYPGGRGAKSVTYVQFQFLERHSQIFQSLAGSASVGFNLSNGTQADRVHGLRVSKEYFRVLGVAPAFGRAFLADEDQPSGPSAIILSDGLWRAGVGCHPRGIGRGALPGWRPAPVLGGMALRFCLP